MYVPLLVDKGHFAGRSFAGRRSAARDCPASTARVTPMIHNGCRGMSLSLLVSPPAADDREQGAAEQERSEAERAAQRDTPRGKQREADHREEDKAERATEHKRMPAKPAERDPGEARDLDVSTAQLTRARHGKQEVRGGKGDAATNRPHR